MDSRIGLGLLLLQKAGTAALAASTGCEVLTTVATQLCTKNKNSR
jgi:hypothetical protein